MSPDSDFAIRGRSDPEAARHALAGPLPFGRVFADLMVQIRHTEQQGWQDAAVVPFGPLSLSPAAKVLHYSAEIFEGHKAYRLADGRVALFRPELNARRLNASARRLRLPEIPEALQLRAVQALVHEVRAWVPSAPDTALYLRPTLIGTEAALGVGPAAEHLYYVIAAPVGSYFGNGFASVAIRVEETRVRAAPGGMGAAKTGGNYAAGVEAQQCALEAGFDQVLWLDARERRYVEELSAMNLFVVQDGVLVTPPLSDTILAGITRQSILELAPELGLRVAERPLAIDDLVAGLRSGRVSEVFAVGTAAVVTPVGTLGYQGQRVTVADGQPGPAVRTIREALTGLQYGRRPDLHGWMRIVEDPAVSSPRRSDHRMASGGRPADASDRAAVEG
jgi:branched-chain amino acid aminotransferase